MSKLDFTKPLVTANEKPVEIITTKGRRKGFPIVGYVGKSDNLSYWDVDGKHQYGVAKYDLSNVLERPDFIDLETHVAIVYYDKETKKHRVYFDIDPDAMPKNNDYFGMTYIHGIRVYNEENK